MYYVSLNDITMCRGYEGYGGVRSYFTVDESKYVRHGITNVGQTEQHQRNT